MACISELSDVCRIPERHTPSPQPSPHGRGSSAAAVAASYPLPGGEGQGEGRLAGHIGEVSLDRPAAAPAAFILDLTEVGLGDATLVGRKAFHLATLLRAGFDVPPGFCITTEAFRCFETAGLGKPMLPQFMRDAIVAAWRRSGLKIAAVRSSASEEDGEHASWAGVFPTVLPVASESEMLAAVETCFRALHAPSVEYYRSARERDGRAPAMAVLVQSLIDADAAGVAFTANPINGARDEIVINAVPGLGEPLSAGRISGDVFVVGRDGTEKSASITAKPFMLTWKGEVVLPPDRAERRAITEAEAAALARLATRVERVFGGPQDIEFAIASGRIYLLQARPITGLPEEGPISDSEVEAYLASERARLARRVETLRREGRLNGADAIFSSGNVGELLPTPTPMSFGLFRTIFADRGGAIALGRRVLGYRLEEGSAEGLYELIGGQAYFNVEVDAGTFDFGLPIDIDSILSSIAKDHTRASYPEFGLYAQAMSLAEAISAHGEVDGPRRHATLWQFHAAMRKAARGVYRRYRGEIEPILHRSLEPAPPSLLAAENAELLAFFQQRIDHLRQFSCVWFVAAARLGFYFADLVRWRLRRHLGDCAAAQRLIQGLDGSLITRQAIELENLAQARITRDGFLRAYGHSSQNELEISLPRFSEDPRNIERLLHDLTVSGRQPGREFREQQSRRRDAERDVRRNLEGQGAGKAEIRAFFADLRLAQLFLPLRETIKHYYTGEYRVLRETLLEINRRLGWKDGDIFYLAPSEISGCFQAGEDLVALVRQRRRHRKISALLAGQRRLPPVIFASDAGAIGLRSTLQSTRLEGAPVAPGSAAGRVRVLDEAADGEPWRRQPLRGDEIIVTHSANLGLAPMLRMSAGLIVEVGGVLAHAACQARESGIPAVVLAGATSILKEGMAISIDGATGRIELIEDGAAS